MSNQRRGGEQIEVAKSKVTEKWVLSRCRKVWREDVARTFGGSEFQTEGEATLKALAINYCWRQTPKAVLSKGTAGRWDSADLKVRMVIWTCLFLFRSKWWSVVVRQLDNVPWCHDPDATPQSRRSRPQTSHQNRTSPHQSRAPRQTYPSPERRKKRLVATLNLPLKLNQMPFVIYIHRYFFSSNLRY